MFLAEDVTSASGCEACVFVAWLPLPFVIAANRRRMTTSNLEPGAKSGHGIVTGLADDWAVQGGVWVDWMTFRHLVRVWTTLVDLGRLHVRGGILGCMDYAAEYTADPPLIEPA